MARAGGYRANVYTRGFRRGDPLPRALRNFTQLQTREKLLAKAMAEAAQGMRDEMSALAPVRTGVLSQSYRIRKLKRTPNRVIGIRVGAVSGSAVVNPGRLEKIPGVTLGDTYAMAGWRDHWAELGTRNHGPQPHVGPAIKSKLGEYNRELRSNLAKLLLAIRGTV